MANVKKQNQLQSLAEFIEAGTNFALVGFEKTTHKALESLRKELKGNGAKVKVVKNTIFEKTVNHMTSKHQGLNEFHKKALPVRENTMLITLGKEWNKGMKAFYDYSKKEKSVTFKHGYLDEQVYDPAQMNRIAELPSREELIGKVIGGMKSPMFGLAYSLKFNLQKLAYVLNERSKQNNA